MEQKLNNFQNEDFLLKCQKADAGIGFVIAANILAFVPILICIIGFFVTEEDYRMLNPFFVFAIFSFFAFCLSCIFTIAYKKLFTTQSDVTAIFILWLPFIPTFFLGVIAAGIFGIVGFTILIPFAIAWVIMTATLLFKRELINNKKASNDSPSLDSAEQ